MDCTFKTSEGKFNYRVGAIILNGRKILMAKNPNEKTDFYYSVGGRVKFGEEAEQSIIRELKEETGILCETERMYCIHENFFIDGDGIPFHEISIFFIIKPNEKLLNIENKHKTSDGPTGEYLEWINLDDCNDITLFPEFFKKCDFNDNNGIKYFISH